MADERNPLRITVAPTDREASGYGVYDFLRGVMFPGMEAMRERASAPGYFGQPAPPSLVPTPEGKLPSVGGVAPETLLGLTDLLQLGMPMGKGAAAGAHLAAPFLPGVLGKALKGTPGSLAKQVEAALGKIPQEAAKTSLATPQVDLHGLSQKIWEAPAMSEAKALTSGLAQPVKDALAEHLTMQGMHPSVLSDLGLGKPVKVPDDATVAAALKGIEEALGLAAERPAAKQTLGTMFPNDPMMQKSAWANLYPQDLVNVLPKENPQHYLKTVFGKDIANYIEKNFGEQLAPKAKPEFSQEAFTKFYEDAWKKHGTSPSLNEIEHHMQQYNTPHWAQPGDIIPWDLVEKIDNDFMNKISREAPKEAPKGLAQELSDENLELLKKFDDLELVFTKKYDYWADKPKKAATDISEKAIEQALAKNPGASIFDLAGQKPPVAAPPLSLADLKKTGDALGSNPGGFYEHPGSGQQFYIKTTQSPEHAANERLAAKLYNLAGVKTLDYVPMAQEDVVATRLADLGHGADKFTKSERADAQKDFAIHAWLANWDVAGLDNSNLRIRYGFPTVTDTGGALLYRAQGAPKGAAFGNSVKEWESLRDPSVNKQTAALFANMTPEQLKASAKRLESIPDYQIIQAIYESPLEPVVKEELKNKLLARKKDILQKAQLVTPTKQNLSVLSEEARIDYFGSLLKPFDWMQHKTTDLPVGLENVSTKHARELGYNPNAPLYKGGSYKILPEFPDPAQKDYERGNFLSGGHEKHIANAYGNPIPYAVKAPKAAEIDWVKATSTKSYSSGGHYMHDIIEAARKQGLDLLKIDNIIDSGSNKPHTQYVLLTNKGIRHPTAEFNPLAAHSPNVLSSIAAGLLAGGAVVKYLDADGKLKDLR